MNIIHISTSDKVGGAALAANRLNKAFNQTGKNSKMIVLTASTTNNDIITIAKRKKKYITKLKLVLTESLKRYLLKPNYTISLGWCGYDLYKRKEVVEADVIYIHWTGFGLLSIKGIAKILELNKPTFIFMHDMWFITGGCHHSFECDAYKSHCIKCPKIENTLFKSIVSRTFSLKKEYCSKYKNLHIITPSNWLANCVRQSAIFNKNCISVIPNLIDTKLFKPIDRQVAREILNLPTDKKIILFGAFGGKSDIYKGWNYLVSSITKLERDDIVIALFGGNISDNDKQLLKFPIYSLGYLHDEYSIMLLYNAANVFVTPSLAENFPNTILESLACGTPVVGFNVGGIPDLIKHKQTGYLANYKDEIDLANGINWVLDNNNEQLKERLHQIVCDNYSPDKIIEKHEKLIRY